MIYLLKRGFREATVSGVMAVAPGEGRGAVEPAHQGGEMAAPGDPGGGDGFQPAPTRRGFGRFREGQRQQQVQRPVTQVPEAQRAEEEVRNQRDRRPERAGGGPAEGQDRSEGATGRRRGTIPHDIIRMMDNERKAKMVSLDFGGFAELPEIGAFHRWLKEQGVVGQDQERRSIQWVFRNEFVKKFFVHMKEDYGAEWLEQEFRGGKDWTDRETGRIIKIWARWEGQTWKEVIIRGIDPRTPRNMVEQGLKEYGEVRGLEFAQLDGITYNQAKVQVRVREGAKLPVYVFAETGETGLGKEERMERWELDYRGRPNVCFGCFKPGHVRHRCARPVTMTALLATGGAPGSYARVLRRPLSQEEVEEATRSLQLEATKVREQEEKEMDEQDPERLEREQILRKEDVCDENANVQVAAQKEAAEKQELRQENIKKQQEEQDRLREAEVRRKGEEQRDQGLQEFARREQEWNEVARKEREECEKEEQKQEEKRKAVDHAGRDLEEATARWEQQQEEQQQHEEEAVKQEQKTKRIQGEKQNGKVEMCSLASCSKPGGKLCTGCRTVSYCSITCQTQDWKAEHGVRCKEVGWEKNKKEFDKKEAERQKEAEEEQKQEDMEAALEEEKFRLEEKERGRKRQLTSPRTGRPDSHRSRTSGSSKSSHRKRSRSGARVSDGKGRSRGSREGRGERGLGRPDQ